MKKIQSCGCSGRGDATSHRIHFSNIIALTNGQIAHPFRSEDRTFHKKHEKKRQEGGEVRSRKRRQEYQRRKEKRRRLQDGEIEHVMQ